MKRSITILMLAVFLFTLPGCHSSETPTETDPTTLPSEPPATVMATAPEPFSTEPEEVALIAPVMTLSAQEKEMLLKIGVAERGNTGCPECIALVMCTVLNRVESGRFGSSLHSVLFSQNQFTPVADGSYYRATPNECCYDALEMVVYGWDESQGALYYEWCEGESWHSQNLNLLFQHCNIRFYN